METKHFLRTDGHKHLAELAEGRLLDVGYASYPNPFTKGAIGVDIQKRPCPENYKAVHVCNLNKEDLPFADKSFDTVTMSDVIEHVENPTRVLLECHRVLKDGGLLLVSTPNACYWWITIDDWFLRWAYKDLDKGAHLSEWTRRGFLRLLNKNGFVVRETYGVGTFLPILHWYFFNKNSTLLGWGILYECRKDRSPVRSILTTVAYGDKKYIWVKQ